MVNDEVCTFHESLAKKDEAVPRIRSLTPSFRILLALQKERIVPVDVLQEIHRKLNMSDESHDDSTASLADGNPFT